MILVSKIKIKNFKTFGDIDLDLNEFNVLVGACGSGKTNFIQIFELLNDIVSHGFKDAIEKHGGKYVKNFNLLENNQKSCIGVKFSVNNKYLVLLENILLSFNSIKYGIYFNFNENECKVQKEIVELDCNVEIDNKKIENQIIIKNDNGEIKAEFQEDMEDLKISKIIPKDLITIVSENFKKENIPIINSALATIPIKWADLFKDISVYDFDPKVCKNINVLSNEKLTKYGENLPVVLKNILNDSHNKKKFLNYYTNILPYVKDVNVEKILDEERIIMIIEKYNNVKIPSPFISDGTSTIMAILIALYFQNSKIILIEEPERHIHPSLIYQLSLMMEYAGKQVIITTHSPEFLKYSKLENILFIYRDDDGFSNIDRIGENKVVEPYIEEFGVDRVFVDDYLGLQ